MTGWNLPPGVNTWDLPGNRPQDIAWERAWERAEEELTEELGREPTESETQARAELLMEEES